ncbi:hypothetical protein FE257_002020 [Aspergillus nanangensis]|uniref:Major facilitator superfamily (MFS) profile domain-containing protein n=1 Tax=Aspergillus nanangensis TaxID=2582783 RepID=A0AAD4GY46_ASPNN|nr:hypothetical protein FE257_002020 [Aspergillus nanangensis]
MSSTLEGKPPDPAPARASFEIEDPKSEPFVSREVDLGQILEIESTPDQQKKVLVNLLPLMGVCYMMQYMDKIALSQATLFDLREDLNLRGQQYSWASAIFYFGYLAWSPISSYLIVRLPMGKYLTVSVFVWGGVLMCHAASKNFNGLMTARFFLGVAESAIAPGFSLITGMFYRREEQPARNAIFLTKTERAIAVQRTLVNKTGTMDTGSFKWDQVRLCLRDPQTWLLVLYTFCVNLCNGGMTSFASILINGFGFSQLRSLLMQMPLGAAQIVFLIGTATVATLIPRTRILMMILNTLASMIGLILVWKLDDDNRTGRLVGLSLATVFACNIPLSLSIISSNVAGFTKRSVTSAMLFVAYCVGNIVGPQFFYESEAPRYPTGMKVAISGLALAAFFLACLLFYYVYENRRRDVAYGAPAQLSEEEELSDPLRWTGTPELS